MLGSTCFGHHYAHHQELTTIALVTTQAVWFSSCCWLGVKCRQDGWMSGPKAVTAFRPDIHYLGVLQGAVLACVGDGGYLQDWKNIRPITRITNFSQRLNYLFATHRILRQRAEVTAGVRPKYFFYRFETHIFYRNENERSFTS